MKQLGVIPYFITLSCADLKWEELLQRYITNLNKVRLSKTESGNYQERCNFFNSNPVFVARNGQSKVEMFFKEN